MASKIGTFLEKIPSCQLDVPLAIDMPTTDGRDKLSKIPGGDKLPDLSTKSQSFQLAVVELQQGNRSSIDQVDPNEVWWDGSDDPENPRNWSSMKKFGNIFLIGTFCFVVPLASSIFAAGIPELMKEFGQSSGGSLSSLVLSIYVLGFGVGPLFWAPLSELYGRIIIYHISGFLFVLCTVACALSTNLNMLIVFRFLAGTMGSATLSNGGGSIADLIVQEKRGAVLSILTLGPLLGPVIGPVCGGFLTSAKGWRWSFYVLTMISGTVWILQLIFMRETYPVVILARKAEKLQEETNNMALRSGLDTGISPRSLLLRSIVRPCKMLFFSPIILGLSLYIGLVYGYLYLLFSTFVLIFEEHYGFTASNVGLTYLGLGIGNLIGLLLFGLFSDRMAKASSKSYVTESGVLVMTPESRLPPMIPGGVLLPIGLFIYGWTAEKHVHYIVPIFGTLLFGIANLATTMPVITYLVDAYPLYAASALAASTLIRAILGAFIPIVAPPMYKALGLGWGNSLIAFVAATMIPVPFLFYRYGEYFRNKLRIEDL